MRGIVRAIEGLSRLCGWVAAALILILIVLMLYDVFLRYVFNAPTLWGFEVSTWTMGAAFLIAMGYALACDAHVRVDLLYGGLIPRGALLVVDLVLLPLLLVIVAWITWGVWEYFQEAWRSGERSGGSAWNPKVWPFRLIVVTGFAAFTLQIVASILKTFLTLRAGATATGAADSHGV